jgi:hypothetical protein
LVRRVSCALFLVGFAACIDFGALTGGDSDSVPPVDAGNDAGPTVDAGNIDDSGFADTTTPPLIDASYCANVDASFCDDFDTVALAVRWSSRTTRAGGTIEQDPFATAPSPPNTLYAMLPEAGAADEFTRAAYIQRQFSGAFTHFDVSFDVYFQQVDTANNYGAILPIAIYAPDIELTPPNYLTFYYYQTKAYAYEQHSFPDGGGVSASSPNWFDIPQVGKWQRLEMAIDLAGDGGAPHLTVTLDGEVVEYFAMNKSWTLGPTIGLLIGVTYPYGTYAAWQIRYDNLVVHTY